MIFYIPFSLQVTGIVLLSVLSLALLGFVVVKYTATPKNTSMSSNPILDQDRHELDLLPNEMKPLNHISTVLNTIRRYLPKTSSRSIETGPLQRSKPPKHKKFIFNHRGREQAKKALHNLLQSLNYLYEIVLWSSSVRYGYPKNEGQSATREFIWDVKEGTSYDRHTYIRAFTNSTHEIIFPRSFDDNNRPSESQCFAKLSSTSDQLTIDVYFDFSQQATVPGVEVASWQLSMADYNNFIAGMKGV